MRILLTIALLVLLGCASNKKQAIVKYDSDWVIKPNGIQTCEDLYEFQEMISRENNWNIEEVRKVTQIPMEGETCYEAKVCDEVEYCFKWWK